MFEHGYMCAKLGRNRFCALCSSDIEQPSDLNGILYINVDSNGFWKYSVAREMISVNLPVDMNKIK